jgi:hypothetical protein
MLVISGTMLIVIAVVYVFVSVLLLSMLHEDLDKDVSRLGFFLTAPIVIVAGMLSAMAHTRGAYWSVFRATVKRIPQDRIRTFVKSVRERHHSWLAEAKSLRREVQWGEQRLHSHEAQGDHYAHRLAEGALNQHWLDATVKVREALAEALTQACKIAAEKGDKMESEAMEALRIRAETAEQMLTAIAPFARGKRPSEAPVHVRTPGGEQGHESAKVSP